MIAKYKVSILPLLVVVSLMSCTSQIPVATNYPYTEQQKMQAAHHLNVLAADVIEQLKQNPEVSKNTPLAVSPKFYVSDDKNSDLATTTDKENTDYWITQSPVTAMFEFDWLSTAQFKRAYQNYLTKHLIDAGYNVVDNQTEAKLLMVFDMQLVKHKDRQVRSPHIISQLGRIIAGGLDGAYDGIKAEKYEAVITTSIKMGHRYLMCHISTYYVNAPYIPPARWNMQGPLYIP